MKPSQGICLTLYGTTFLLGDEESSKETPWGKSVILDYDLICLIFHKG
jgi:hypothetical protein